MSIDGVSHDAGRAFRTTAATIAAPSTQIIRSPRLIRNRNRSPTHAALVGIAVSSGSLIGQASGAVGTWAGAARSYDTCTTPAGPGQRSRCRTDSTAVQ